MAEDKLAQEENKSVKLIRLLFDDVRVASGLVLKQKESAKKKSPDIDNTPGIGEIAANAENVRFAQILHRLRAFATRPKT